MAAEDPLTSWRRALASYQEAVHAFRRAQRLSGLHPSTTRQSWRSARGHASLRGTDARLQVAPAPPESTSCAARLTKREREIAWLIARGLTNSQIALALTIEKGTVANHVAHILNKLEAINRTQVAAMVLQWTVEKEQPSQPMVDPRLLRASSEPRAWWPRSA
jgi:DNA-binding NarL/FixJ family response regulator